MTYYIQSGNTFNVIPGTSIDPVNALPANNFVLKYSPMQGFFLEQSQPFTLPSKIYGKSNRYAERILNTFKQRNSNTGVMLMGEKGSGKSLLCKQVCMLSNLPVIIINDSYTGDNFNSYLSSITQPSIILFDEFEKVYDKDDQKKVLTFLDGTFNSNKLFMFTSNDRWGIDENMCNRPGRIYYMIEFKGLDEEFILEYCADKLIKNYYTEKILAVSKLYDVFNFDLLQAFVDEVNRYDEEPETLIELLNAKPRYNTHKDFRVNISIYGNKSSTGHLSDFSVYDETLSLKVKVECLSFCLDHLRELSNNNNYSAIAALFKEGSVRMPSVKDKNSMLAKVPGGLVNNNNNKINKNSIEHQEASEWELTSFDMMLKPEDVTYDYKSSTYIYFICEGVQVELKAKSAVLDYACI